MSVQSVSTIFSPKSGAKRASKIQRMYRYLATHQSLAGWNGAAEPFSNLNPDPHLQWCSFYTLVPLRTHKRNYGEWRHRWQRQLHTSLWRNRVILLVVSKTHTEQSKHKGPLTSPSVRNPLPIMKLFRTSNTDIIEDCCNYFKFKLPSELPVIPGTFPDPLRPPFPKIGRSQPPTENCNLKFRANECW